jgi:RNA polymerase sigma-70 factor, ECF subfamily
MEATQAVATDRRSTPFRRWPPRGGRRREDPVFEVLYRDHAAEVYQYALTVLTNPADAEDVTQTTFLNAYSALQRGQYPHRPHNWLIKIAHNVCRQRFRQSTRRPQEVPYDETVRDTPVEDGESPTATDVVRALSCLPVNQRAALVLREVDDRSYEEIAKVLDISVAAVESLLFRARSSLRTRRSPLHSTGPPLALRGRRSAA